jgi:hypothetical protein
MENNESSGGATEKIVDIKESVKDYLDMRISALKLQIIEHLSIIMARIVFYVLLFVLLSIALFFIGSTFSLWMGELVGSEAAGALITASIFLVICLIIFFMRKKIFVNSMVGMFSKMFFEQRNDDDMSNK